MNVLLVVNGPPYGSDGPYNALRLAMTLQREQADVDIRLFLLGDGVTCALSGQTTPQGYYNLERMVKAVISKGGQVRVCGSCAETRGMKTLSLIEGAEISTMSQLAQWVSESDKALSF